MAFCLKRKFATAAGGVEQAPSWLALKRLCNPSQRNDGTGKPSYLEGRREGNKRERDIYSGGCKCMCTDESHRRCNAI